MLKKCFTIISSLAFTATTGIICPLNTKAIEDIEPVEVVSMRSEYEKHYDNGDGTYTAYIDTAPIHYYENGEWLDIDNTLIQDENGNYVNRSNSMKVTLSPETSISPINAINEAYNNDNQMVSIDYNGYSLSWSLIDTDKSVIKNKPVGISKNDTDVETENPEITDKQVVFSDGDIEAVISYEKVYPVSEVSINEQVNAERNIGMNKLNDKISKSVSNLNSSVSYNNISEAIDCKVDIQSNSVKETLILENPDNILEEYSYLIQSNELIAELCEDNSVVFSDGEDTIFTIPAPFMFDSSYNAEDNYSISVSLEETDNGYIYTLSPDMDWLSDDARVYPVMIDPYVIPDNTSNITCRYNSEANPTNMYYGIKLGGESGNAYETYIDIDNDSFSSYPSNMCITEANFYMRMKASSVSSKENNFKLYAVDSNVRYVFYNDYNKGEASYCKYIKDVSRESCNYDYGWTINITELANAWFNYAHCGDRKRGIPQYGFKLVADAGVKTREGYNTNVSLKSDRPYFGFTYEYSDDYYLPYVPERYNNINDITNFQNSMNCYAYALQTYYRDSGGYKLNPGEIGLSSTKSIFNNRKELMDTYDNYTNTMKQYIRWDGVVQNSYMAKVTMKKFNNFIKEQMLADADVMGFNIIETDKPIPDDFDEYSERIIAMVTCYKSSFYGSRTEDDDRTIEFHFLLRNGNGTCPNGHGDKCSMWTQKNSLQEVRNTAKNGIILCDANISDHPYSLYSFAPYIGDNTISYFRINKSSNIYNSSYGDGRYDECTGTPYYG